MHNYFKNITLFKTDALTTENFRKLPEQEGLFFRNCHPTQKSSFGFNQKQPLTKLPQGDFVLNFTHGERKVNPKQLAALTLEKITEYEKDGVTATKKVTRELKEDALMELLPRAFEEVTQVQVFYHFKSRQLVVNVPACADFALLLILKALAALQTTTLHVANCHHSLTRNLQDCIADDTDYAIGRFGYLNKLHMKNDDGATARFDKDFEPTQISELIDTNYVVEKARLTSRNVSFDLDKSFRIRNLAFEFDVEDQGGGWADFEDRADYDAAVMGFQLGLVADLGADLVKTFEEKSKEYQNA